ncbi:MFS transporter [Gordonia terrae]|uniref:Putative proline/betaine transporter n=2 Tax=Gordonia TaxID=2053 RepID=A0A2I1R406_9ACTN|nr:MULTISPECIES: MFS transporter [Gordonia]PKZ63864.1 MFS transporter [Gordonia terrae]UPW10052.1 MHS family MFS transporter [Gordonia terrae]SDU79296.1 metabolite-proton symporter [Gordonia westfalica]
MTPTRENVADSRQPRSLRAVIVAALGASTLEWYDFYIYGTAAALVFNKVFFPSVNPALGTLAAFATFGVGFLFRPLGGIIFGHFGDTLGRKKLLVIAMMIMGISTFLIGVLPTYSTVGILAPILLVVLRAAQGLAVGGQYGGAMLLVTENAPAERRGYYGSFSHIGPSLAVILSNVVFLVVVAAVSPDALVEWAWRIPFLLSVVVVAAGIYMQLKIEDTAEFRELQARRAAEQGEGQGQVARRSPIIEALRTHPKEILQAGGMILIVQVYYYVLIVFTISYATSHDISRTTALVAVLLSSVATVVSIPIFAAISDSAGRKPVLIWSAVATTLTAFPFVLLLGTGSVWLLVVAVVVPGITLGALYGPMAAFYYEMFSAEVRYSGASIGYQLGAVLGGGFSPLIATSLLEATGSLLSVGAFITVAGLLSIWAIASVSTSSKSVTLTDTH